MTFFGQTGEATPRTLTINVAGQSFSAHISNASTKVSIPLTLSALATVDVDFSYTGALVSAPGDPRQLAFAVGDFKLE
jgi:hypothetical protein